MAQLYTIKCPNCGKEFKVGKGVFMSWDFTKPIPKELREETPFNCPHCNHKMSVRDKHFDDYILDVIFID